jgi:DNA phosphorothioation-dependent restriction protein DptH
VCRKKEEKCRFSNDDFATLSEDALVSAKVAVSVIGNESLGVHESEEIIVRFGQPPERMPGGVGKKVRAFSEGLVELAERDAVSELSSSVGCHLDTKGYVVMRTREPGKAFRVFYPPLISELDRGWGSRGGVIGRWTGSSIRSPSGEPEFLAMQRPDPSYGAAHGAWDRASTAGRKLSERFAGSGERCQMRIDCRRGPDGVLPFSERDKVQTSTMDDARSIRKTEKSYLVLALLHLAAQSRHWM